MGEDIITPHIFKIIVDRMFLQIFFYYIDVEKSFKCRDGL